MDAETYKKAEILKDLIYDIKSELELWEKELTSKNKMGYLQGWNNNHPTKFETKISDGIFESFRFAAMDNLKLKLIKAEKDFSEL